MVFVWFVRFIALIKYATRVCSSNGSDFKGQKHKTVKILKIVKISFRRRQKFWLCSLSTARSLKVFTLGKRDSTFQNCQTKMFNLICVSFRSDKNYRSYKPKRKVTVFFCTPFILVLHISLGAFQAKNRGVCALVVEHYFCHFSSLWVISSLPQY